MTKLWDLTDAGQVGGRLVGYLAAVADMVAEMAENQQHPSLECLESKIKATG